MDFASKLQELNEDYQQVDGKPCAYFFCPILFKDENAELCEAHIVNRAFPGSDRSCTIQRKDVDGFYGSNFESDFLAILYHENMKPVDTIMDGVLHQRFRPRLIVDGNEIEHFFPTKSVVPSHFTPAAIVQNGKIVEIGLKLPPSSALLQSPHSWELAVTKDVRVAAVASLLKAAHLTLFETQGYQYALSASGHFVGRNVLGEFYLQNLQKSKADVTNAGEQFFAEFAHMVRPVEANTIGVGGTITDGAMLLCGWAAKAPWAVIVFVKTSQMMHAVMIPLFDKVDAIPKFLGFLRSGDEKLEVNYCRFIEDHWDISPESALCTWPKPPGGLLGI